MSCVEPQREAAMPGTAVPRQVGEVLLLFLDSIKDTARTRSTIGRQEGLAALS